MVRPGEYLAKGQGTLAAPECEEAVADGISLAKLAVECTLYVGTGADVDGLARHRACPR